MLFQREGDMLVMGGKFQEQFTHAVPGREQWMQLLDQELEKGHLTQQLEEWEVQGIEGEVSIGVDDPLRPCFRYNTTIRWHYTHSSSHCPWRSTAPAIGPAIASAAAVSSAATAKESLEPASQATEQVQGLELGHENVFAGFCFVRRV
jgi:hypothetical protein